MNETQSVREFEQGSPPDHLPGDKQTALEMRQARLHDYLRQTLAHQNPLLANLGAINSDLMRMAYQVAGMTEKAFLSSDNPLQDFPKLMPTLDFHLKLTRQIDRFAQLEERLGSSSTTEQNTIHEQATAQLTQDTSEKSES